MAGQVPTDENVPTERLATAGAGTSAGPERIDAGTRIGNYRVEALLGRGGMGEVYRAEQLEPVRRTVALKLLHWQRLDARELAYFEVERQVLAQMQHPAIAQIFDAGATVDGVPWFAMEFIEGRPLNRYCEEAGLDLRARLELFMRVCEGVQHAHQKGVIHRDLKPQNILVAPVDGRPMPKIIDFGIATAASRTLAAGREVTGTPAYMSPEQAGHVAYEVDIRSDVYSLGVVLYELLAGLRPEAATGDGDSQRTLRKPPSRAIDTLTTEQLAAHAQRQGLSRARLQQVLRRDLDWIVMRAIQPQRDARYPTATALAEDIRRFLELRPVHAAPGGRLYVADKFVRRHRIGIAAGGVTLLALLAGLSLSLYGLWQAEAQRALAEARSRELEQVVSFQQSMLEGIDNEGMGRGLLQAQRRQVEAALAKPGAPALALADWDGLMARTAAADLARGVLDEHVLARALTAIERDFAAQPRLDADLRESVAEVYQALGSYARAAELLPMVVAARQRELGPDHPATIRAQVELGAALHRSGRLPEARALQQELRARAATLAPLPDAVRDRIELDYALTLSDQGEVAAAIQVQEALLARIVAARGERDPEALKVRNNLAISLMRAGRREAGREQFEALLAARRELLGPEHDETLASLSNLAAARAMVGDLPGALALQEEAYAIRRRQLGEDHPQTLADRSNLGSTLSSLGRLEEAREHLAYAVDGRRRVLGSTHPQTLRSILNLGAVLSRLGQHQAALGLQQEAYEARRASLGAEHPDTLNSAMNVATTLRDAGRARDGLALAEATLALRQRVLGPVHPDTLASHQAVASVALAAGERGRARQVLEAALALPELPEAARLTISARLHAVLAATGEEAAAARLRREVLEPFLQRDPASLQAQEKAARDEVLREMGGAPG